MFPPVSVIYFVFKTEVPRTVALQQNENVHRYSTRQDNEYVWRIGTDNCMHCQLTTVSFPLLVRVYSFSKKMINPRQNICNRMSQNVQILWKPR